MRFGAAGLVLCAFVVASCARGASDAASDAGEGLADDAAAGSSGGGQPGVYDGGPPAVIGGPADATAPSDAATDAKGASSDGSSGDGGAASCGTPSGTFTSSCTGCGVADNILSCSCTNNASASVAATLDLCSCPITTIISNTNGVLSCCGIAGGSYTSSCTSCSTTDSVLSCTCTTDSKSTQQTSLDLCTCTNASQINNTNGQLTCN